MRPASARRQRDRAAHPAPPAAGARSARTIAARPAESRATGDGSDGASDAKVISTIGRGSYYGQKAGEKCTSTSMYCSSIARDAKYACGTPGSVWTAGTRPSHANRATSGATPLHRTIRTCRWLEPRAQAKERRSARRRRATPALRARSSAGRSLPRRCSAPGASPRASVARARVPTSAARSEKALSSRKIGRGQGTTDS
jgi:hypothetical protein